MVMMMKESMPTCIGKTEGEPLNQLLYGNGINFIYNSFVKTIRSWDSDDVDDDEFAFTWYVDRNLRSGRYFVEIFADDDDDDDVSRSFIFDITSGAPTTTSPPRYPTNNNNNSRYKRPAMRNNRKVFRPSRGPRRMKNRHYKRAADTC